MVFFDENNANDGEQERSSGERENWVGRILEMRSFWKDKDKCKSAAVMEPLKNQSSSSRELVCSEDGDGCGCCYTDDRSVKSPMVEVPRIDVKHDRNSFSRFPPFACLCRRSNSLPSCHISAIWHIQFSDIKPGELLKKHRLRFITSSLEKKMEAANKAKELLCK
ncbi:hypothetical protein KI387_011049 [Taxus chinensis]|uniref:Uncharacterized protein n=1 Tax=Taxus chinensis TaxID=29808 RepID=A0AA38FMT8_TAXCH|nr:hypothetical protein KI387_011049 [Taxus chinensis]